MSTPGWRRDDRLTRIAEVVANAPPNATVASLKVYGDVGDDTQGLQIAALDALKLPPAVSPSPVAPASPSLDVVAAMAMQGILAAVTLPYTPSAPEEVADLARTSYECATALLVEGERRRRGGPTKPMLAHVQPCGCVVCYCAVKDEGGDQGCRGICGAKACGAHPLVAIPNPVYADGKCTVCGAARLWDGRREEYSECSNRKCPNPQRDYVAERTPPPK